MTKDELMAMAVRRTDIAGWVCVECRRFHGDGERGAEMARYCCTSSGLCGCGGVTLEYHTVCETCRAKNEDAREAERFAKAEKAENWAGPVMCEGVGHNDGYFANLAALLDYLDDDSAEEDGLPARPGYAYVCDAGPMVSLDVDRILESATEDHSHDGFDLDDLKGVAELKAAVAAFEALNTDQVYWEPNYKKVVLIPSRAEAARL